jgi:hypothetical protein
MFLHFKKILNSNPAQLGDIIVRADSIFLFNNDILLDQKTGLNYNATRVELSSFPNYSFHTPSTMAQVSSVLNVIDLTGGGSNTGSSCAGSPGVLDIIYLSTEFPLLQANMLVNSSKSELEPYVFNPEYIVFTEEVVFQDRKTQLQDTAVLLVLRDSQPKRIMTDLDFSDLLMVLEPTIVPI